MPTLSSQMTSAVFWHLRRQHDLIFGQSLLQPAMPVLSPLGWFSVSTGEFVAPSRWRLLLAEAHHSKRRGGKKNPNQDVCTCCSLLARLGVLLKDWDICRAGGAAAAGACPARGWSSSSAGGWAQPGGRAAGPGSRYPEPTQTDVIKIQA